MIVASVYLFCLVEKGLTLTTHRETYVSKVVKFFATFGAVSSTMDPPRVSTALWKTQLLKLVEEAPKAVCVEYENDGIEYTGLLNSQSTSTASSYISLVSEVDTVIEDPPKEYPNIMDMDIKEGDELQKFTFTPQNANVRFNISRSTSDVSAVSSQVEADTGIVINISCASTPSVNSSASSKNSSSGFRKAFHGILSAEETQKILTKDGNYLLRVLKHREDLILTVRFNEELYNYVVCYNGATKCYFLEGKFKAYDDLEDLVQEGLVILYLDMKAGAYMDLMLDLAQNTHSQLNSSDTRTKSQTSRKNSYANLNISRQTSCQPITPECDKGPPLFPTNFPTLPAHEEITINVRRHSFELQTFPKGTACSVCHKDNWGKNTQGMECKDCGAKIHEKCFEKVIHECQPDLSTIKAMFGADLTTLVKATGGNKPVFVIEKCVTAIENCGIESEGIYRVSGSKDQIDQLKSLLEKDREGADVSICTDVNSLCGVIKLYLRSLPEPLITNDVFKEFVALPRPLKLEDVKTQLQKLPLAHGITLKFLLKHLQRVATKSKTNKMSAFNLSSVLSPSITCPLDMSLNTLQLSTDIVEMLIRNVDSLEI